MIPQGSVFAQKYQKYVQELSWKKEDVDDLAVPTRKLLDIVAKSSDKRNILLNALKRIVHRMSNSVQISKAKKTQEKTDQTPEYMQLFLHAGGKEEQTILDETKLIIAFAVTCAAEILFTYDTLDEQKISAATKRIAYLYPVTFLHAGLLQKVEPAIVACYSYVQLRKMLTEDLNAIKALTPALPKEAAQMKQSLGIQTFEYVTQLEKIEPLALNQDIGALWHNFMLDLTKHALTGDAQQRQESSKLIKQFATTIAQLNDLNILDLWINTSFVAKAKTEKNAAILCKELIEQVQGVGQKKGAETLSNNELISLVKNMQSILTTWNNKVDIWGDPAQFQTLYKQFEQQLIAPFIIGKDQTAHKEFEALWYTASAIAPLDYKNLVDYATHHAPLIVLFNKASALGKLVLLQLFKQLIDVYDLSIKGLTGSPLYKDKDAQAKNFATLLVPYLALMEEMTVLVREQEKELFTNAWGGWSFEKYLSFLRERNVAPLIKDASARSLKASNAFIVGAAQLGSKVDFACAQPQSLEDIFTLAHQNMIVTLSALNKKLGLKKELLPQLLQNIGNQLESIIIWENINQQSPEHMKTDLVGIDYHYPHIVMYYNIPLRQHSSTFEIQYNKNKPDQAILMCKFFGHNEKNRMNGIVTYAYLAAQNSNIAFARLPHSTAATVNNSGKEFSHITEFAWIITPKTNLKEIKEYLKLFADATINFFGDPRGILTSIHKIKPFITQDIYEAILKNGPSDYYLSQLDYQDPFKAFPILTEQLFARDTFLNAWMINSFMADKLYNKALNIIEMTLNNIIKNNMYDLPSNMTTKSLWQECINRLIKLLEISETQAKTIATITRIFTPYRLDLVLKRAEEENIEIVCNLLLKANEMQPNKQVEDLMNFILNNPAAALFLASNSKIMQSMLKQLNKGTAYEQEVYTKIYQQLFDRIEKYIQQARYDYAYSQTQSIFSAAQSYAKAYEYAQRLILKLIASEQVMVGTNRLGSRSTDYEDKRRPGIQYVYAATLAEELVQENKKDLAQPILKALQDKKAKLEKEAGASEDQKTAYKNLEYALSMLEKTMQ
jgi:hypothetical protein